jgi:hypothetical protein
MELTTIEPVKLTCHKKGLKLVYEAFEASLAQLVEQYFRKVWVAGSNPATGFRLRAARYGEQARLR